MSNIRKRRNTFLIICCFSLFVGLRCSHVCGFLWHTDLRSLHFVDLPNVQFIVFLSSEVSGSVGFWTKPVLHGSSFPFLRFMGLRLCTGIWFLRFMNCRTSGFYDSQFCELWNCVSGNLRSTVLLSFLHCGFRGFAVPTILVSCFLGLWSLYACRGQCFFCDYMDVRLFVGWLFLELWGSWPMDSWVFQLREARDLRSMNS